LVYSSIGKPLPNKKAGRMIMNMGWRLDKFQSKISGRKHILTKEVAKYALMDLRYSNKKIKSAIGLELTPVSRSITDTSAHFISDFAVKKK
jgi:hypothetical protein